MTRSGKFSFIIFFVLDYDLTQLSPNEDFDDLPSAVDVMLFKPRRSTDLRHESHFALKAGAYGIN